MTITPEQLEKRKGFIGSSEAAVAAGCSPYMTPRELWMIKTGRIPPEDISENNAVQNGTHAEAVILSRYVEDVQPKAYSTHADNLEYESGALLSHPDMVVTFDGETWEPVDAKLRSFDADEWGGTGSDRVPRPEICQAYHQALCMGAKRAHIAAWLYSSWGLEYRHYTIEIDPEIAAKLLELWATFWGHVESDTDPGGDIPLKALIRRDVWTSEATRIPERLVTAYTGCVEAVTNAGKLRDDAKKAVYEILGDSQYGVFADPHTGDTMAIGKRNGRHWIGKASKVVKPGTLKSLGFDPNREDQR